ncbi:glycosyltransferase family 4 protein [Halalkalirubrum salinum]|uniref:glycosyltransferase family 4 protein n=1 Tax=Halalkalirubrum salinum TaxID=2563889 RepID=UPI0010FB529C|nr:glycosyltransferase family 4 protein [Halalkalirubrum salinum]
MRIALLVAGDFDAPTGGYLYDRRLVRWLRSNGDSIRVYTTPHRGYADHLLDAIRPTFHRKLRAIASDADVLIIDGIVHPSVVASIRLLSTPTVALCHLLEVTVPAQSRSDISGAVRGAIAPSIEAQFLADVDGVIYNSETTKHEAAAIGTERSIVAPPAGDRFDDHPCRHRAVSNRDSTQEADEPLSVLALGTVCHRKGHDVLLEAIARLDPTTVTVTIVGRESAEPKFAQQMRQRARQRNHDVTFTGAVSDDAVATALADADVLAVPSRYESFGIVYLEAMGFGTVPIATDAGAPAAVIGDGGIIVPSEDSAALADAIASLASDRDRLRAYATRAIDRYDAHPSFEETMRRLRGFIAEISESST